ncbi:MAG: sulfatase-like hydrolase/transferase, partial [Actinomycetota bacterium]|nr:sulfatase-like hydrolase/transferase [Actinomycetota bacterium]
MGCRSKRWRGGSVAALVLVTALGTGATQSAAQSDALPPNVLIIITDDQRASGTLDVMPRTMRWFAQDGTLFANALATTPTCCPSRASVMTGLYAHNHGVQTSERGQAEEMEQQLTMQRYLHLEGYRTGIFGKYLNAWPPQTPPPWFDEWAILSDSARNGYLGGRWNVQGELRQLRRYSTRVIEDRALDFIANAETDDAQPWLLYLSPQS